MNPIKLFLSSFSVVVVPPSPRERERERTVPKNQRVKKINCIINSLQHDQLTAFDEEHRKSRNARSGEEREKVGHDDDN